VASVKGYHRDRPGGPDYVTRSSRYIGEYIIRGSESRSLSYSDMLASGSMLCAQGGRVSRVTCELRRCQRHGLSQCVFYEGDIVRDRARMHMCVRVCMEARISVSVCV
jgi:hypothetical protein